MAFKKNEIPFDLFLALQDLQNVISWRDFFSLKIAISLNLNIVFDECVKISTFAEDKHHELMP